MTINVTLAPVIVEVAENTYTVDMSSVGAQGPQGVAGSIISVSASSLSAGASPTVVNNGTINNAQLAFGIPRGDTGTAATIAVNSTTTGSAGTNATVVNSGTSSAAQLDFTIPRGNTGLRGRGYDLTSNTNRTVSVGASVIFTTFDKDGNSSQGAYFVGVNIIGIALDGKYFYGTVGSLVSTSGISVNITAVSESGGFTSNSWSFQVYGVKGDKGDTGIAATATAGTTTTVDGYNSANVVPAGTESARIFNFTIPTGVAIGASSPSNTGVLWADTNTSPTITAINGGSA